MKPTTPMPPVIMAKIMNDILLQDPEPGKPVEGLQLILDYSYKPKTPVVKPS